MGGGPGDSGIDRYPLVSPAQVGDTWDNNATPRLPVFLWEVPSTGNVVAIEARDGGFSLWRTGDQGAAGDGTMHTWCASAASELGTRTGTAYRLGASTNYAVAVDDVEYIGWKS